MGDRRRGVDGVLTWDETFMAIARVVAKRSKDPSTQVGAVIVGSDHRVLSLGYNGAPHGFSDDEFPWGKKDPDPRRNKYLYVVHSERNAILNYRGSRRDLEGSTVYVTLFPCNECMKEIVQSGVSAVRSQQGRVRRPPKHDGSSGGRLQDDSRVRWRHPGEVRAHRQERDGERVRPRLPRAPVCAGRLPADRQRAPRLTVDQSRGSLMLSARSLLAGAASAASINAVVRQVFLQRRLRVVLVRLDP